MYYFKPVGMGKFITEKPQNRPPKDLRVILHSETSKC